MLTWLSLFLGTIFPSMDRFSSRVTLPFTVNLSLIVTTDDVAWPIVTGTSWFSSAVAISTPLDEVVLILIKELALISIPPVLAESLIASAPIPLLFTIWSFLPLVKLLVNTLK